ncbi:MAG: c-type cytochrome, partial [Gammaproteobacteria bacterium]
MFMFHWPIKRAFRALFFVTSSSLLLIAACGAEEGIDESAPLQHQAEVKLAQADAAPSGSGAELYQNNCGACHQANGQGLAGAFPPLAESDYFAGNP